jgi:(S)-2-hydroxyglutarate dehydrogenase
VIFCDFLIIGGGIIGLTVAKKLKEIFHGSRVILLEKESDCGLHASGRNSGVLHAGFYYSENSLKSRFSRDGNRLMTQYCLDKNLKINKCGKLVVAKNESELTRLDNLLQRGKINKVDLKKISKKEAQEIEPRVKTFESAIFSPTTSSIDPTEIMASLKEDALTNGVEIYLNTRYLKRHGNAIITNKGIFECGFFVNAAGLYSDKIAMDFGFSKNYRILPFKGLYLYSEELPGNLKTHIYPVPDPQYPFLGVHFTIMVDGKIKIGPTAIPAFWREQYSGFDNFDINESMEIIIRQLGLLTASGFNFKQLAFEELKKYSKSHMTSLASGLVSEISSNQFSWGKPGIRAQLIDLKKRRMEMDFILEGDDKSLHILNAVSPGFTCAFPMAEYVCESIKEAANI